MLGILAAFILIVGGCTALLVAGSESNDLAGFTNTTAPSLSDADEGGVMPFVDDAADDGEVDGGSQDRTVDETPETQSADGSNLTPSQQNAVRSAESYLDFSSFSRQGLIDQLSSEFGDQFPVEDATVAVDSLNVDWNAEAAEAAQSYVDFSGFSCQGLVDQLSSEFGDQFTLEQATYGAAQTGIC